MMPKAWAMYRPTPSMAKRADSFPSAANRKYPAG